MDLANALSARPTGVDPARIKPGVVEDIDRRYAFLAPLPGGGHSGAVWSAHDKINDITVAVRLFRVTTDGATARAEVDLQRRLAPTVYLDHPNIARTNEVRELGGAAFLLATELVAGSRLSSILDQDGAFGFERMLDTLIEIGCALEYAHSLGIWRLHLAPGQIVFSEPCRLQLLDWGLTLRPDLRVSPHWLAPEPVDRADHRADIYLLGVLAFVLATGESPFGDGDYAEVLLRKKRDKKILAKARDAGTPQSFDYFLERTIRHDPGDRYATMAAALSDLRNMRQPIVFCPVRRSWLSSILGPRRLPPTAHARQG